MTKSYFLMLKVCTHSSLMFILTKAQKHAAPKTAKKFSEDHMQQQHSAGKSRSMTV